MSLLTEALERISSWLEQHQPEIAALLQPGLTFEEIEEETQYLPFQLPKEVYEIYQWRNGTYHDLFYGMGIYPLEIVKVQQELIEYISSQNIQGFPMFFGQDDNYPFVACDREETSPVLSLGDEGTDIIVYYTSLTNMVLTMAESYEAGLVCFSENRFGWNKEYYNETDEKAWDKFEVINQKYNSLAEKEVIFRKYRSQSTLY